MILKKIAWCILTLSLVGCAPSKRLTLTIDETNALKELSGNYKILDARKDYTHYTTLHAALSANKGVITMSVGDNTVAIPLTGCSVANMNKAELESLFKCDIERFGTFKERYTHSRYERTIIYFGKVKPNYTVSDPALFKLYTPMVISGGYYFEIPNEEIFNLAKEK